MAAVPPPLPPLPGADAAPTQPTRKRTKRGDPRDVPGPIPTGANPTSSFAYADSLNVSDSQAVRGSTTYMPDEMGVALNSSAVAFHQVQLTGGGNLGSNNDNASVIPAGTGVSNNTGQNNIMEERSWGENTNTLSNSRDTPNASSMGPPVAAANATAVSIAPDGAPATAVTSQQQSRRRSSSGCQLLLPHDLVNNLITDERVSGTKHKVVAMKPNPGGRKWVAADNNCVEGAITNGPPAEASAGEMRGGVYIRALVSAASAHIRRILLRDSIFSAFRAKEKERSVMGG